MKLLSSILIAILLFSCNMPDCKSSNPVFDTAAINSKAYNMELVSQLQNIDEDNLRYWIIDYTTDSTGEYLITAVQDDDSLYITKVTKFLRKICRTAVYLQPCRGISSAG